MGGGSVSYTYNPATPTCGGFEGQRCAAETKMSSTKTVKTSFAYDAKGNLTKVTPPKPLGETTYTYDSLGRTETLTDGRGIKKVFVYDNLDRVKTVSTTNDTVRYYYDGDGNLAQRTDSTGTIKYAFDPLQRETVRTSRTAPRPCSPTPPRATSTSTRTRPARSTTPGTRSTSSRSSKTRRAG
ncbi:RHS repeat domain-containing protein [Streptomyces sp. NPDC005898]|uniref:RHS repeat domain-containing protein n=1 Tax=Streptomyces sp. NPDC005898 TaxID=3157082 RepID=UPI00340657C0